MRFASAGLIQDLLMQAGISPSCCCQRSVSSHQYRRTLASDCPTAATSFGMDSLQRSGQLYLAVPCHHHSDTLERALLRATRFLGLVLDELVGELSRDAESAHIVLHDLRPRSAPGGHADTQARLSASRAFAYGTYMIVMHGLACWLVGRRIPDC